MFFRPYIGLGGLCTVLSNSNIGLQKESRGKTSIPGLIQNPNLTFFNQLSRQFGIYGAAGFEVNLFRGLSLVYGAQVEYTKFGLGINSSLGLKF
jgi:2,3-bisphosphoglycerate-independent phosphoglycerate mutase